MIVDLLYTALGLVILLFAGDSLVKGAVNLALRLGIPAFIVSLTIVAFGTSAPELLISFKAIADGVPGLALGNVVGSNTANILLVLGVPALIAGIQAHGTDTRANYVMMLAGTFLFTALTMTGEFSLHEGLILLLGLAIILAIAFRDAMAHRRELAARAAAKGQALEEAQLSDEDEEVEGADPDMSGWKIGVFLVLGLAGLPLGADLLVDSSTNIAKAVGVSDTVIGLTLVALGTSLPELATTVMAALRKQADVALGNVIGSNMFNMLAIIGLATFGGTIPVDPNVMRFDIWVMLGASLILAPFVFKGWRMGKRWGAALVTLYVVYVGVVLV